MCIQQLIRYATLESRGRTVCFILRREPEMGFTCLTTNYISLYKFG